jgi:hypothetical protein
VGQDTAFTATICIILVLLLGLGSRRHSAMKKMGADLFLGYEALFSDGIDMASLASNVMGDYVVWFRIAMQHGDNGRWYLIGLYSFIGGCAITRGVIFPIMNKFLFWWNRSKYESQLKARTSVYELDDDEEPHRGWCDAGHQYCALVLCKWTDICNCCGGSTMYPWNDDKWPIDPREKMGHPLVAAKFAFIGDGVFMTLVSLLTLCSRKLGRNYIAAWAFASNLVGCYGHYLKWTYVSLHRKHLLGFKPGVITTNAMAANKEAQSAVGAVEDAIEMGSPNTIEMVRSI